MAVRLTALRAGRSVGRPPFIRRKISGTHLCQRLNRPKGHNAAGRITSIEKSSDIIVNGIRDLAACSSIVPQLTTVPRAPQSRPGQGLSRLRISWFCPVPDNYRDSALNLSTSAFFHVLFTSFSIIGACCSLVEALC
jgi:hypothetical protein